MAEQIVEWTSELETGVTEIDAQHKTLFDLLNRLQAAVAEGREQEVIGEALVEMSSYADKHFKTEQQYVELDPGFKDHLLEHWDFSKKCISLVMSFRKDNSVSMETIRFLLNWLKNHILERDVVIIKRLKKEGRI